MILDILGQRGAGKTHVLLALLQELNSRQELSATGEIWAGCKPFDTGRSILQREDRPSDGERIQAELPVHTPHLSLVAPYHAHENYSPGFSLRCEGIVPRQSVIEKQLSALGRHYRGILVESPAELLENVFEDCSYGEWLGARKSQQLLWVQDTAKSYSESALLIAYLKECSGQAPCIVLNCRQGQTDTQWLTYLWQELQRITGCEVIGVIPHQINQENAEKDARTQAPPNTTTITTICQRLCTLPGLSGL